ncbi:hypothetical protein H4R18_000565 [Coemansia javaensis]|uniref:F-box domain-containing protein n=1 Tax=Coemansia javaensis TaxID=2761396 RepID=A0A9W8HGC8_9FUNG|nr:hypothetical protein H4R18_000565 [Coemansia javaensis]
MHLCDLPDDVLRLILQRACACHQPAMMHAPLRDRLPLLAVCRRLRALARAVVYSAVDIQLGDDGDGLTVLRPRDKARCVRLKADLDAVAAAGCLDMVRHVDVGVFHLINPIPGLRAVAGAMCAAAGQWASVRSLAIHTHRCQRLDNEEQMDAEDLDDDIPGISAALAAVLPGLQRLVAAWPRTNAITSEVVGALAARYADQLRVLRSDYTAVTPPGVALRRLESVYIPRPGSGDDPSPRVDPAELRVLQLHGWPENHSWAAFSADGDGSKEIRFPRLQVLDLIRYKGATASGSDNSGRAGSLHFPELRTLAVKCLYDVPALLVRGVFPARMDRLSIETTSSALLNISSTALPSARRIHITLQHGGRSWCFAMVAAVRGILDAARDCDELELTAFCGGLFLRPGTLASAPLTRLSVMVEVHADIMVALVQSLPRLSSLVIRRLMGNGAWLDTLIPEPGAAHLMPPVTSTLGTVHLGASPSARAPEAVVSAAKYLLLAAPSLSYLSTIGAARLPIEAFVGERASQYPHLAKARFSYLLRP